MTLGGVPSTNWRFAYRVSADLPPLFWVARIAPPLIEVTCGKSVRRATDAFIEGTWSGGSELREVALASTVYATGIVLTGDGPLIITQSHVQECLWVAQRPDATFISNSIAGLLQYSGQRLDPNFAYPNVLYRAGPLKHLDQEGEPRLVNGYRLTVPTLDGPIDALYCENFRICRDGRLEVSRKSRQPTFVDFADYSRRLRDATRSLMANAQGYSAVIALSGGYDSTAVAAVVASVGGRRAVGVRTARRHGDGALVDDSGASTAARLGLEFNVYDRLDYLSRTDLPEAEFLFTGMSGEDVVVSAFESELRRALLFTGHWGGRMWSESWRPSVRHLPPPELSGNSHGRLPSAPRLHPRTPAPTSARSGPGYQRPRGRPNDGCLPRGRLLRPPDRETPRRGSRPAARKLRAHQGRRQPASAP